MIEVLLPHRFRTNHPTLRSQFNKQPKIRPMGLGRDLYGLHKDGHEISITVGLHPFSSNHNSFILASIVDITERKRQQRHLETLFELAPFALLLVDPNGTIIKCNHLAENLLGYASGTLEKLNIEIVIPEGYRNNIPQWRAEFKKQPGVKHLDHTYDVSAVRKNGSTFPVEINLMPLKMEDTAYVLLGIVDITVRKKTLHALEEQARRLMDAETAKAEFLANMSHEFRTPLQSILSFADFGKRKIDTVTPQKLCSYFEQIKDSGQQLLDLVNQVLDLSCLEANRMTYNKETIDLFVLVEDILSHTMPWLAAKKLKLATQFPETLAMVSIDLNRMKQVFNNLVSNAVNFCNIGSTIRITGDVKEEKVWVRVSNIGIPIPADEQEKIFEKFFQSSATKTGAGGTGLGLSICHNIIEDHKGQIWCESDPAGETVFTVTLPLENQCSEERS